MTLTFDFLNMLVFGMWRRLHYK